MKISILANFFILFSLAFAISSICVPLIIKIAKKNQLYSNVGGGRHIHSGLIPRLGGIAILVGFLLSQLYLILQPAFQQAELINYYYLIFSMFTLFILGLLDDLVNVNSYLKFFVQLLIAIILVSNAELRILSFYGLFGLHDLPVWFSYLFSILVVVFFINAYNLIDGLDGLSCMVGLHVLLCFLSIFLFNKSYIDAMLAVSAIGCLLGFLLFNRTPAKIFMGDSGTLCVGLLLAYFSIQISNLPLDYQNTYNPVVAMVILSYPTIDTLRVFIRRIITGKSPFSADRNHIHHALYDLGFGHTKSVAFIIIFCIIITVFTYFIRTYHNLSFFISVFLIIAISQIPFIFLNKKFDENNV